MRSCTAANTVGLFLDFGQVLAALATFVIRPVAIQLVLWLGRAGPERLCPLPPSWPACATWPSGCSVGAGPVNLAATPATPHRPLATLGISLG
jgi:hypothetical protein